MDRIVTVSRPLALLPPAFLPARLPAGFPACMTRLFALRVQLQLGQKKVRRSR